MKREDIQNAGKKNPDKGSKDWEFIEIRTPSCYNNTNLNEYKEAHHAESIRFS